MTVERFQECGAYWQSRFNLPEWRITFKESEGQDAIDNLGSITWVPEEHTATLSLRIDHPQAEATLVHEMLHLVWQGHGHYRRYSVPQEAAINRITAALVPSP